jgi:hypothetical protein
MPQPTVKVLFRVWSDKKGGVDALMPELPATADGYFCECFSLQDGHSSADFHGVIEQTRPATPEEYRETARRMRQHYGYRLKIIKRASYKMHEACRQAASQ